MSPEPIDMDKLDLPDLGEVDWGAEDETHLPPAVAPEELERRMSVLEWADLCAEEATKHNARACWWGTCRTGGGLCPQHYQFKQGARAGVLWSLGMRP